MTITPLLTPYALGPAEGHAVRFGAHRLTMKAPGEATGGAFALFECELSREFEPPLHATSTRARRRAGTSSRAS